MEERKIILPTEEEVDAYNSKYDCKFEYTGDEEGLTDVDKQVLKKFDDIHKEFRASLIKHMRNANKKAVVEETKVSDETK